jgi:acylphosphatase
MAGDRIRRRVVVHGRVQGVFFRGSTQEEARRTGSDGWVRNLPDGAVEAVFEGEAAGVEQLVAYCRRGPPWAEVTRVDVIEEAPEGERGFRVRY